MSETTVQTRRIALAVAAVLAAATLGPGLALAGGHAGTAAAAGTAQPGSADDGFVRGSPDVDVVVSDPTVDRRTNATVTLELLNAGEVSAGTGDPGRVTTARGVSVTAEADDDAPFEVTSGTAAVGTLTREAPAEVPVTLSVPTDAEAGSYDLEVEVEYTYTSTHSPRSGVSNEVTRTETVDVTVAIEDGPQFRVVDAATDAPVGGSGNLTLTLENVGGTAASDASVDAGGPTVHAAGGARVIDEWAPGETKTVTYNASVDPGVRTVPQEVTATVEYTDPDGARTTGRSLVTSVTPAPEQSVSVTDVESSLEVGDDGAVTMALENDGPAALEALVVRLSNGDELGLAGEEYAVGDVAVGETATVEFETTVGDSVDPGPRLFTFEVDYRNGDERRSLTREVTAPVDPATDEFGVELVDGTVTAGGGDVLEVAVTNRRDEPVSEVSAKVFAESPLTATDDEAFVDELEPGETAVLRFEYRAGGDALAKEYPVALDFRYEDHRGETRTSETYRVPVTVEPAEGGGVPGSVLVAGGLLAVGATGFVYRRRSD